MEELDQHGSRTPAIHSNVFVARTADIIGDVTIGQHSSVWYQCVLRADINAIRIGRETNIQDGTVIHVSSSCPAILGDRVSCGHRAIIHACHIEDEALIGMGAIIMDQAKVGHGTIIGAGSLVTIGTKIPPGVLAMGTPARVIRELTDTERNSIPALAMKYCKVAAAHAGIGAKQTS